MLAGAGQRGRLLNTMVIYLLGSAWVLHENGLSSLLRQGLLTACLCSRWGGPAYGAVFGRGRGRLQRAQGRQNYLLPILMILIFPMMIWWKVLEEPTSTFATASPSSPSGPPS